MLVHLGDRILYSHVRNQIELYILTRKKCHNVFLRVKSKTGGCVYRPFVCVLSNYTYKKPKTIYVYIDISMHDYCLCRDYVPQTNKSENSAYFWGRKACTLLKLVCLIFHMPVLYVW